MPPTLLRATPPAARTATRGLSVIGSARLHIRRQAGGIPATTSAFVARGSGWFAPFSTAARMNRGDTEILYPACTESSTINPTVAASPLPVSGVAYPPGRQFAARNSFNSSTRGGSARAVAAAASPLALGQHSRKLSTAPPNMYTTSFAFFEALWDAGVTHCFVNLGSDHPSIIEAMVKGAREKKDRFPRIITCPNEVRIFSPLCRPSCFLFALRVTHRF